MSTLNVIIGIALVLALIAALGYALVRAIDIWNTRPVSMYDHKAGRWRAHSLQGKPWNAKRHGAKPRPLEPSPAQRAWNDPLWPTFNQCVNDPDSVYEVLEQARLEQPPTQALGTDPRRAPRLTHRPGG